MPIIPAPRLPDDRVPAGFGHIPGLDGLRALSISIVLAGHFLLGGAGALSTIGVYVFFVISGYLITRLMLAERKATGSFDVGRFWARRVLRLYPVLIVYLAVGIVLALAFRRPIPGIEIVSALAYFVNYLLSWQELHGATMQLPYNYLWSLSVEEQFYILMPLVFMMTRGRHLVAFAAIMCVVPLLFRIGELAVWPRLVETSLFYRNSETRFDSIAFGVLIAAFSERPGAVATLRRIGSPTILVLAGIVMVASFAIPDGFVKIASRDTLRAVAAVPLLCSVLFSDRLGWTKRLLETGVVAWVGRLSYSLYLWHGVQAYFLTGIGVPETTPLFGIVAIIGTFMCATGSYYGVERPALRLKRYLQPAVPKSATVTRAMTA